MGRFRKESRIGFWTGSMNLELGVGGPVLGAR